ncbi:MAG: DUF1902 domain-containing protein [Methylophaga sp.]|nr:DUF1902 domain-containing protein [Methylophaga sp.]
MNYPISYPLANFFSALGIKLIIRIDFIHDKEADVFVATSKDIQGLVVEAASYEELQSEIKEAIATLSELSNSKNNMHTDVVLTDRIATA